MPQNPVTSDRNLCECQPEREHNDYSRTAEYMHEGTCPVAERQMAPIDAHLQLHDGEVK